MPEDYLSKFEKIISSKLQNLNNYQKKLINEGIPIKPVHMDLLEYNILTDFIEKHNIHKTDGNFAEAGALFGGGTSNLSKFIEKKCADKKLFVIDAFDFKFDLTDDSPSVTMADNYKRVFSHFGNKTQHEIFEIITTDCKNLVVIQQDSKNVTLDEKLCFGYISENNSLEALKDAFNLLWNNLNSGGYLVFHNYKADIINPLLEKYKEEIAKTDSYELKNSIYIIKK